MAKFNVFNDGYVTDTQKVDLFISRLENLILELYGIDLTELYELLASVKESRMYHKRVLFLVETYEYELQKLKTKKGDLPF